MPLTFRLPPIPTPPATVSAPVVTLIDGVVALMFKFAKLPVLDNKLFDVTVLPTYKSPPMPAPPRTWNAPVFVLVALVILVTVNVLDVPFNGCATLVHELSVLEYW